MRLVALALVLAGCQVDVSLGQLPIEIADAGEDASVPDLGFADAGDAATFDAFVADSGVPLGRSIVVNANADVMCFEGWAGREADFINATPTMVGLSNGPVELTFPTVTSSIAYLTGQALFDSFGVRTLPLELLPPEVDPPPGYYGMAFGLDDNGPMGTLRRSGMVAMDLSSHTFPVMGIIGVELGDSGGVDSCFIQYQMQIRSN